MADAPKEALEERCSQIQRRGFWGAVLDIRGKGFIWINPDVSQYWILDIPYFLGYYRAYIGILLWDY